MNPEIRNRPLAGDGHAAGPLTRALNQSEQVQDKVERAAVDLGSVNTILKEELRPDGPVAELKVALHRSEVVEQTVNEAADELAVINDALADGSTSATSWSVA
jgi:hypothetical protein